MKPLFFCLFLTVATSAQAETVNGQGPGAIVYDARTSQSVCLSAKNAAGEDAPVMIVSQVWTKKRGEVKKKMYNEGLFMSKQCLNWRSLKNVTRVQLRATAPAEPITLRLAPTRKALKR